MFKIFPPHAADSYKLGHLRQYPIGTEFVYQNFTARSDKLAKMLPDFDHKVVFAGLQGTIMESLIEDWDQQFFSKPKLQVLSRIERRIAGFGVTDISAYEKLWELGYLPLHIKALPEGSRVNIGVPMFTVVNTHPDFHWLPGYIEDVLSSETWKSITNATIANEYRRLLDQYAIKTGSPKDFVSWQGHDFAMRGMSGIHDAAKSGFAHLLSFLGTDSIVALDYAETYYSGSETFLGGSVPATEHSVMCMGGKDNEIDTFRRLIKDLYPSGVVSIVSDSWDFWKVITEYAHILKEEIVARTPDALGLAKVVFRPDSGDPVKIICGTQDGNPIWPEFKGAVECLWDIFGGTYTDKGYRLLNQRVGLIYGDSITLERASAILAGLDAKGFASGNIVFGIGSYTYQHSTRDTFGHAYKATWGVVDGGPREIFKDPATGDGLKKSAKGLLKVIKEGKDYKLIDQCDEVDEKLGLLQTVFLNGKLTKFQSIADIRTQLRNEQ